MRDPSEAMTQEAVIDEKALEKAARALFYEQNSIMHDHEKLWNAAQKKLWRDFAQAAIHAYLHAQGAGREGEPFDTAPKDGRKIQAWHRMHECWITIVYSDGWPGYKWVEATKTTMWPDEAFTHWKPQSPPPSAGDAGTAEGYVLVPVEPTEAMISAMNDAGTPFGLHLRDRYKAALTAAPKDGEG